MAAPKRKAASRETDWTIEADGICILWSACAGRLGGVAVCRSRAARTQRPAAWGAQDRQQLHARAVVVTPGLHRHEHRRDGHSRQIIGERQLGKSFRVRQRVPELRESSRGASIA